MNSFAGGIIVQLILLISLDSKYKIFTRSKIYLKYTEINKVKIVRTTFFCNSALLVYK